MNATALLLACMLTACVSTPVVKHDPPPMLRLAPSALGRTLALQQALEVTVQEQTQRIEVMLEADPEAVRMALVSMGQTMARLTWDGTTLSETRAPWLPDAVRGDRILSDLQLVLWPADAVRAALPEGWSLDSSERERVLRQRGEPVVTVNYVSPTRAEIVQWRDGYRISIESRPLGGVDGGTDGGVDRGVDRGLDSPAEGGS